MDGKTLARIGAVIFVALAITATAIEMNRPADRPDDPVTVAQPVTARDPLRAELARCGGMGEAGGLVAFGTTVADTWRRIPAMVDRVLKGTAPAVIPVEFVTRRELVLNAKVAEQIGVTIPPPLLSQADRVIR